MVNILAVNSSCKSCLLQVFPALNLFLSTQFPAAAAVFSEKALMMSAHYLPSMTDRRQHRQI